MDEEDAIRRCQNGDRDAFRVVAEQYGKVLLGTAYMMTRNRPQAEDLVQEAYILAWVNIASFKLGTNLKAWLLRILVNRTISEQRKKRVTTIGLDKVEPTLPAPDSVVQSVIWDDEKERIGRGLATLPPDQRRAVVLRYYADMTVPEIAKIMGWRQGTVKSRLHRALARLRPLLEDDDFQTVSVFDKA